MGSRRKTRKPGVGGFDAAGAGDGVSPLLVAAGAAGDGAGDAAAGAAAGDGEAAGDGDGAGDGLGTVPVQARTTASGVRRAVRSAGAAGAGSTSRVTMGVSAERSRPETARAATR